MQHRSKHNPIIWAWRNRAKLTFYLWYSSAQYNTIFQSKKRQNFGIFLPNWIVSAVWRVCFQVLVVSCCLMCKLGYVPYTPVYTQDLKPTVSSTIHTYAYISIGICICIGVWMYHYHSYRHVVFYLFDGSKIMKKAHSALNIDHLQPEACNTIGVFNEISLHTCCCAWGPKNAQLPYTYYIYIYMHVFFWRGKMVKAEDTFSSGADADYSQWNIFMAYQTTGNQDGEAHLLLLQDLSIVSDS